MYKDTDILRNKNGDYLQIELIQPSLPESTADLVQKTNQWLAKTKWSVLSVRYLKGAVEILYYVSKEEAEARCKKWDEEQQKCRIVNGRGKYNLQSNKSREGEHYNC